LSARDRIALCVATGFGAGRLPVAPGTAGTAVAAAIVWGLSHTPLPADWTLAALALCTTLACIPLGNVAERALGRADPQPVVLDEFAGLFVALLRLGPAWPTVKEIAVAFLLFRLFDIIKPPPARRLQDLHGGLGIVLDDVVAGLYALMGVVVFRDVMAGRVW
jgi:phosphatidylglycerophosphatase A